MPSGPNSSNANVRSGRWLIAYWIGASVASKSGSGYSFQVFVRWKEIPQRNSRPRSLPADPDGPGDVPAQVIDELADQRVKGLPSAVGRVVAVWTTKSSSSRSRRRGRPPAHQGLRHASPISLNLWIRSRTVSSSAWTARAMTGTVLPRAEASSIIGRRNRTELLLPRGPSAPLPGGFPAPRAPKLTPELQGKLAAGEEPAELLRPVGKKKPEEQAVHLARLKEKKAKPRKKDSPPTAPASSKGSPGGEAPRSRKIITA